MNSTLWHAISTSIWGRVDNDVRGRPFEYTQTHWGVQWAWLIRTYRDLLPGVVGKRLGLGWVECAPWNSAVQVVSLASIIWLQMCVYVL